MIKNEKPFKTVDEQIELLIGRGLEITNKEDVHKKLLHNNYYTVVNGYKYPFLDREKEEETYKAGTSFDELFALYTFDCNLRALLFKYILKIEHQLKSVISHYFAQNHRDEKYPNYLDIKNFDMGKDGVASPKKKADYEMLKRNISDEMNRQLDNNNKMLEHYQEKYQNIPPWILVSIFSFGTLRTFFCCLSNKEQNEISRFFGLRLEELKVYLSALNTYRNACAHDERIYNLKLKNKVVRRMPEDDKGTYSKKEYNRVYVVFLILKDMLDAASFMSFYSEFDACISELKRNLKTIKIDDVFGAMGMPVDSAVRKAELGPLERGDALANHEFKEVLQRYIIPMFPISSELKELRQGDFGVENVACNLVELKNGNIYFAQSTNGNFVYYMDLNESTVAKQQIEVVEEHLQTLIDYIHVFWNLSNLSKYGRDKVAVAFPTLCEQAYELTICKLMCKCDSRLAQYELNSAYKEYRKNIGAESKENRKVLTANIRRREENVNDIIALEGIAERTLYGILTQIEAWANKTYEGQKKTFGIVLCKSLLCEGEETFNYVDFLKSDYSATINDGVYSAVELYADGMFKEHITIENTSEEKLYSIPYPFSGFANLCTDDKIGILLTSSGDILIISNHKLCYTRHNGHWVQSMADKVIEQIKKELGLETNENAEAIYQAIVDASYNRGGACMGIICEDELPSKLEEKIEAGLLSQNSEDEKLNAIKRMISISEANAVRQKNFFELNRALRRELLELDGAMVLSSSGKIHVIGTIIKLDGSGSAGGGRTAAAMQLSEFGLAIKVSQDGYVQLFRDGRTILEIMT